MEDQANPLMLMTTSQGAIYVELLANEAPDNVARFIELAEGQVEFFDEVANATFTPRYYDGMRFHRVLPDFVIQGGSPFYHPLGAPEPMLADEINAIALGLDRLPVLNEDGSINPMLNVGNQEEFAQRVLEPLYRELGVETVSELDSAEDDIVTNLRGLTVMRLYEYEGYAYRSDLQTRGISRGTVALANDGPNRNGPEFFIALRNADWLNGRHTVIGRVVEGMDIADRIGGMAIDPTAFNPQSSVIYSIRRLN
jgi:cyclophilin family peptidyl-prolyl cis-trans isomerase